ncbi:acyltransferase family protein [Kineococcus arenarius]|uniref:acyltransferase family protein n=1 Tax=Kineococcus sp. SYSU DK007 TaxID=3383128 RepID=UPI003D7E9C7E
MSHGDFLALRRIPSLDGLRAVSILLVITAHPAYEHFWPSFHGHTGVSIFFVLSGFLITTLALREAERSGRVSLSAFYVRRAFRIYPLYYLVLGVYCFIVFVIGIDAERSRSFAEELPWYLLGTPEHAVYFTGTGAHPPFTFAWSLGVEEKFYLVWPLVGFVLLGRRSVRCRSLLLATVVVACTVASAFDAPVLRAIAPYGLLATGCLSALLLHEARCYRYLVRLGEARYLVPLTALLLLLQFGTREVTPGGSLYVVYGLVVAPVMIGVVVRRGSGVGWLNARPVVFLGTISFGLYLTNALALDVAERVIGVGHGLPGSLLSTLVGFVLAVVASACLHRWFEEPLHSVGRRIARAVEGRAGRAAGSSPPAKGLLAHRRGPRSGPEPSGG